MCYAEGMASFTRTATAVTVTAAAFFMLTGCVTPTLNPTPTFTVTKPAPTQTPTPTPTPTPDATPTLTSAAAILETLTVADEVEENTYDRDFFNHWITQPDGCDTRDAVLIRDGQNTSLNAECKVTGTWFSVYDAVTVTDPSDLDIDHMVPLKEAWVSGAYAWTDETREAYANDLTNPVALVAVTASSNRSKGDRDPAEWMPTMMDGCEYVTRWVDVKAEWNLTVDPTEKDAILSVLSWCD